MKPSIDLRQSKTLLTVMLLTLFSCMLSAQQKTTTDTVCVNSQDVVYGILTPSSTSNYNWTLSGGGTIDNTISSNDSIIEIDWGATAGTYTLSVYDLTNNGCGGDTVTLDIVLLDLPTVSLTPDTVCAGNDATLTFTLTGQGPWDIDYTDGTNNYSITGVTSSPHSVTHSGLTSNTNYTVSSVTDANGCSAANLPSTTIVVYPAPGSNQIFHY